MLPFYEPYSIWWLLKPVDKMYCRHLISCVHNIKASCIRRSLIKEFFNYEYDMFIGFFFFYIKLVTNSFEKEKMP